MIRAIDKWLIPYLRRHREPVPETDPIHVFLAVCDHFEPLHDSDKEGALHRIGVWQELFPDIVDEFQGIDGQPPKHSFFYPIEQYDSDLIGPLAELCHATGSEVEIHLHHENDTSEGLEEKLETGKRDLASQGLLPRDPGGEIRYGFIHGNWALNNADPEGRGCGVDREIPILKRTGCYADFTLPSAPHPTQARVVNSIYYAKDQPGPRAHDQGVPAAVSLTRDLRDRDDHLLLVQGPLCLNRRRRKWGLFPRLENADLSGANPPTLLRFGLWIDQHISVAGRPDWFFVKLHTHGGIPQNYDMLLGEPIRAFHRALAELDEAHFKLHYVTAREMANLVRAAEDGMKGDPSDYRDYWFTCE